MSGESLAVLATQAPAALERAGFDVTLASVMLGRDENARTSSAPTVD